MRAREITFRAWSKHDKRMVAWDEMLQANNPSAWFTGHLTTVVLMQSTGIRDGEGEIIFEGDILNTEFIKGEAGNMTSCVIWNEFVGAWMISYTGAFGDAASDYLHKYKHTIIGNIAENAELLPKQSAG